MLYFAYGSNLFSLRLKRRVPSATLVTTGKLTRHRLLFHKIGRDGSAKCDACFTGKATDFLLGAVYRIKPAEKPFLDRAEGLGNGYAIKDEIIITGPDGELQAFLYYATRKDPLRKPFDWYKEHVLSGAWEHGFPEAYIRAIAAVDVVKDPDPDRAGKERGIYLPPSTEFQLTGGSR